jgi:uncharacterized membrane protein
MGIQSKLSMASIAAMVALSASAYATDGKTAAEPEMAKAEKIHCTGINTCKGTSDCAVEGSHQCKGHNSCAGQGFVALGKDECLAKGGTVG